MGRIVPSVALRLCQLVVLLWRRIVATTENALMRMSCHSGTR